MARPKQYRARPGISMMEMLIVVAALGIIGAMAIPMFSGTDVTRLTSAASVLAADLDAARAESIAHSEDQRYIVFDNDHRTWYLAANSDTATPIDQPDSGMPYRRTLGTSDLKQLLGVTIDSYDLDTTSETNDNKLGFGIYGQTDQSVDATITLASGDRRLTLTVNATTGEVTIGQVD